MEFAPIKNRDASASIRGYIYQIQLTVKRWLELGDDDLLLLESGEDIDTAKSTIGTGDEIKRILEQVKDIKSQRITLRNGKALEALSNFLIHKQNNPDLQLFFLYTTTSSIGIEKPKIPTATNGGIAKWQEIHDQSSDISLAVSFITSLRRFIGSLSKPETISDEGWKILTMFFKSAGDTDVLDLIHRFNWSTEAPEIVELSDEICLAISLSFVLEIEFAQALFKRLFYHVAMLLCRDGAKQLTRKELFALISNDASNEIAQQFYIQLSQRIDIVEGQVAKLDLKQFLLQSQVENLLHHHGSTDDFRLMVDTPNLTVPELGNTIILRDEIVKSFVERFKKNNWLALYGNMGAGTSTLSYLISARFNRRIRISLGSQLTSQDGLKKLNNTIHYYKAKGTRNSYSSWYSGFCKKLSSGSKEALLLIEDLPELLSNNELVQSLKLLSDACQKQGIRFLTTSHYRIPEHVRILLSNVIVEIESPGFTHEEIQSLLDKLSAPKFKIAFVNTIRALSHGHPILTLAIVKYLEKQEWKNDLDTFSSLVIDRDYFAPIQPIIVKQLLESVSDVESRELLYRITLFGFHATLRQIIEIASVSVPISRPQEKMRSLVGLWINPTSNNTFTISPLVKEFSNELNPVTKKDCHKKIAEILLRKKSLTPVEITDVIINLLAAKEFIACASVFVNALSQLYFHKKLEEKPLLLSIWRGMPLPTELPLSMIIAIRSLQIGVGLKYGEDVAELQLELKGIIAKTNPEDVHAVIGASYFAVETFSDFHFMFCKVLELLPPDTNIFEDDNKEFNVATLAWSKIDKVNSIEEAFLFLDLFERMQSIPWLAVGDSIPPSFSFIIAFQLYMSEMRKAENERDFASFLKTLEKVSQHSLKLRMYYLWASITYFQEIILLDFFNDLESAEQIATDSLAIYSETTCDFLIKNQIGIRYAKLGKNSEARKWLQNVEDLDDSSFPDLKIAALIWLGIVEGSNKNTTAKFFEKALVLARVSNLDRYTLFKVLSGYAILFQEKEDYLNSYRLLNEAAIILFKLREDTIEWKSLEVIFGHTSGYICAMATTGMPPKQGLDGLPYVIPNPGVFFTYMDERASFYYPANHAIVCCHLSQIAESLNIFEDMVYWAEKGLEWIEQYPYALPIPTFLDQLLPFLIKQNQISEALDYSNRCWKLLVAMKIYKDQGGDVADHNLSVDALLGDTPNEKWVDPETRAFYNGLLPILFEIGRVSVTNVEVRQKSLYNISQVCYLISENSFLKETWINVAKIIEEGSLTDRFNKFFDDGNKFFHEQKYIEYFVCYFLASIQSDAKPDYSLSLQIIICKHLFNNLRPIYFDLLIVPFLRDFWKNCFANKRFLFSSPSLVAMELDTIMAQQELSPKHIFKAIAVGLRIDKDNRQWINE